MKYRHSIAALFAILIFAAYGCSGEGGDADATADATPPDTQEVEVVPPPPPDAPVEFAGAHILIMYEGSQRAPETVTRNKEEALELANELAERAQKGEDFAELAIEYSDGPSGPNGGNLGTWQKGRMVPEFDTAMEGLDIGEVSDPVETGFGYHVMLRKPVEKISARHILVMYEGSQRKPPQVTRTEAEALLLAEEVLAKAEAGENFEDLAREYSDGPSAPRGGDLGSFGRGAMVPAFEDAAFGLDVGQVSGIVQTPFGYHIIQRYQ